MYCPSCDHRLEPGIDRCDLCGFHMGILQARFGRDEVAMEQITDTTHFLRTSDKDRLLDAIDDFERQFPQFYPAFYLAELPEGTKLTEFAAWMLNHARVSVLDELRNSENVFLFIIDLTSQSMTMNAGYRAEQYVSENDLRELLHDTSPYIAAGDLCEGLEKLLDDLRRVLRRNHRLLLKNLKPGRALASAPLEDTKARSGRLKSWWQAIKRWRR